MTRIRALSGVLVLSAVVASAAEPADGNKDPQSSFEARSQPGVGQKFLEKLTGDWQVVRKFYPRSGEPVETTGVCHQAMIHQGRFLKSEFTFEQNGKQSTGLGIIGFDADSGRFTSFWTDSRSTRMSVRQSEDKFNGMEIVLFSRSLDANEKQPRRSRTVTRLEDDGRRIVHRQYTAGQEGKERLVMELKMTQRADVSRGQ